MTQLQTFILAIALLVAGVALVALHETTLGTAAITAVIGLLIPSDITGKRQPTQRRPPKVTTSPLRFGKKPRRDDHRTLQFEHYASQLPSPAPAWDVLAIALAKLNAPGTSADVVAEYFPMDGNDQYGCCTIAAAAHAVTVYEALVGKRHVASATTVEHEYFALTDGQDSGLNELDVLNHWRQHSVGGQHVLAYAAIDPKNHTHVQQAISLFGGVYLGFQVQEAALDDFNAGRTWTPGKLTGDGHAVYAVAYDADTVTVLTWGAVQKGTWAWWDECVDEAYAILPIDAKKAGFAPGYDIAALEADLDAITH